MPRSLFAGLLLFISLTTGIGVAMGLLLVQRQYDKTLREVVLQRHQLVSTQLVSFMMFWMEQRLPTNLGEIIGLAEKNKDIERIQLTNAAGVIRHSSLPELEGRASDQQDLGSTPSQELRVDIVRDDLDGHPMAYITQPLLNEKRCVGCHHENQPINGYLQVRMNASRLIELEALQRRQLFISGAAYAMLAIVGLLWLLHLFVKRPLRQMLATMKRISAGEIEQRVHIKYPVEFIELAKNFNLMVDRLQQTRQQLQEQTRRSMTRTDQLATVGELATGLAHEIQNPLTGFSGTLQILQRKPELAPYREVLVEMLATVQRLSRVVIDLLEFGRKPEPVLQPFDINEIIADVVAFMQRYGKISRRVTFEQRLGEPTVVEIDRQKIRQVLINVCLNGLQAMPDGGTLRVATRVPTAAEKYLDIIVEDTGCGIPPEQLDRIFRPFYSEKMWGTGLGLPISLSIMEAHGGTLEVESRPGEGSKVFIRLPKKRITGSGGARRIEQQE